MSKFLNSLNRKLLALKNVVLDERIDEDIQAWIGEEIEDIRAWIDDEGTDLEDLLTDFEEEDILSNFLDEHIPTDHRVIILSDINAEADFDEMVQIFKSAHPLTEIY